MFDNFFSNIPVDPDFVGKLQKSLHPHLSARLSQHGCAVFFGPRLPGASDQGAWTSPHSSLVVVVFNVWLVVDLPLWKIWVSWDYSKYMEKMFQIINQMLMFNVSSLPLMFFFLSGRFWWSFWLTLPPLYLVWTRVSFFAFILRIGLWMSSHSIAISSKVYHIS